MDTYQDAQDYYWLELAETSFCRVQQSIRGTKLS